jgi:hypothetical protein
MTTTTASHTNTVAAMYEFGRGDLAGILSHLS